MYVQQFLQDISTNDWQVKWPSGTLSTVLILLNSTKYKKEIAYYVQMTGLIFHIAVLDVGCCILKLLQLSQDFWFTKNLDQICNFWQVLHWQPKHDMSQWQI